MSKPNSNPRTRKAPVAKAPTEVPEAELTADGTLVEQTFVPAGLRRAAFRDEQGANVYTFEVPTTGGVVYAREMDDETYGEFVTRCKAVVAAMRAPALEEPRAQELDTEGKHDEAVALRQRLQQGYRNAQQENAMIARWVFEKTLAGWDYERPFSVKAFGQLNGDDQQLVMLRVIEKSGIGREDADFLVDDLLAL